MTPPPTIGPYHVLEILEARAFTVTFRAEQPGVGRTVLLKALKSTVAVDSPFAEELVREATLLGGLDDDGVIRIHDFVRTSEALYLVLEDPRGAAVAEILRAAKIEVDQAVAVALSAARALAHLHERGVVHGGFGPGVTAVAAHGRVLLTDLSHARPMSGAAGEPVQLCEPPREPGYLAPEQIGGEPATQRSDVWSLGVLLHELIAGARPFDAEDPRKLGAHIRADAPAPLRGPPSVTRVAARCLAKLPDDRYADAREVVAALEDTLAGLSRLPVPVLVSRALAAARLGEAIPPPVGMGAPEPPARAPGPDLKRAALELVAVLGVLVIGGAAIQISGEPDQDEGGDGVTESSPASAGRRDRGLVRVVARPWAEVFIDGEPVDVTPIGKPIPVPPGKHFVTMRHPNAPDEQRAVKVLAGQTVFLDVTMRVDRGDAGAAPADGGAGVSSP